MTAALPFPVYDADNHFYEPEDAITRHLPEKWRNDFQFVTVDGRKKLAIGGKISNYIPNPTFERVAAPGAHLKYYRAQNPEGLSLREITGKSIVPPPSYRYGKDRVAVLDQHHVQAALFFPTLFSAIENRMSYDHDLLHDALHSLNQWTVEEWGFGKGGRLYGVPIISLANLDRAVAELDWLLKQGASCVCIRPAPVPGYRGSQSMGLKEFDPFWARVNESKIFVAIHAADTGYERIAEWWGGGSEWIPFAPSPFFNCLRLLDRAISDTVSALICHGVFERHPNVRIAAVENGAFWVEPMIKTLHHVYGQMPQYFKEHPVETFRRHVFVAPFVEDSFEDLAKHIDVSRILFGSDYPHPEGTAEPLDFLAELTSFNAADKEKIMSSNLKGLLEGKRD